jgi:hypothetical protein
MPLKNTWFQAYIQLKSEEHCFVTLPILQDLSDKYYLHALAVQLIFLHL